MFPSVVTATQRVEPGIVIDESESMLGDSKVEAFAPYHDLDSDSYVSERGFSKVNNILAQLENLSDLESNFNFGGDKNSEFKNTPSEAM